MSPAARHLAIYTTQNSGFNSLDYFGRSPSELRPLVVLSKYSNNAEILAVPLQAFQNLSTIESEFYPWEEKDIDKVFWRGSSTGGFNHQRPWQDSHRMRLHLMINGPKGKEQVLKDSTRDVMMPDGKGGFNLETLDEATLTKAYMDVGLSGKPIQVSSLSIANVSNGIKLTVFLSRPIVREHQAL